MEIVALFKSSLSKLKGFIISLKLELRFNTPSKVAILVIILLTVKIYNDPELTQRVLILIEAAGKL